MNKPNQNIAMKRAGTKVVKNAERDVEPPIPRLSATSELEDDAFPRAEPTLVSLLGSYSTIYGQHPIQIHLEEH